MIYFVVPKDTDFAVVDYLVLFGQGLAGRMEPLYYDDLPHRSSLPAGTYIFSALDQLLPGGRRLAAEVHDQLAAGQGVRLLNNPSRTLLRHDLLDELFRLGLNRHRAVRATGDLSALRYPVFVREEDRHTGSLTLLLNTPRELEAELGRALVRGLRHEELLVVEYCDTSDAQGYFRKYAAFVVGSEIIPRSLAIGHSWVLKHAGSEFTREMFDEERAYVLANPHEAQLRKIFEAARVGYGRIDYALRNGEIETWEINLNPTIGRGQGPPRTVIPAELQQYRTAAREHFFARFQAALEAIDSPASPSTMIPIRYRPETASAARRMARERIPARRFESVKALLRPFRPLLDPIVRVISPLLARIAQRTRSSRDG